MERKTEIKTGSRIVLILALVLLVAVTAGVSYAFFTYTRLGLTENTITTGTITFLYDEKNAVGNGISIVDALPTTDDNGKILTGTNNVFDFRIIAATTGNTNLPYEITARKKDSSDVPEDAVKIYLTEVTSGEESATPLTMNGTVVKRYSELTATTVAVGTGMVEKTIFNGNIPVASANYEKNFRLRMWIADDVNYSPTPNDEGVDEYPMNNKNFTLTVNVYANATVITAGE